MPKGVYPHHHRGVHKKPKVHKPKKAKPPKANPYNNPKKVPDAYNAHKH